MPLASSVLGALGLSLITAAPAPGGACCHPLFGCLDRADEESCAGIWYGNLSSCDYSATCFEPHGVCCFEPGCDSASRHGCGEAGGRFRDWATDCTGDPCSFGACFEKETSQ